MNATDDSQGLFGLVDDGKIANLGIGDKTSIRGNTNAGGVVGSANNGTKVYNCYNKARIEGISCVGGITGGLYNDSSVVNCFNLGSVIGTESIGGIVGNSDTSGQILNCYNKGSIEGILPGGIAGQAVAKSIIRNCYNTGNVTKIEGETWVSYRHYSIVGRFEIKGDVTTKVNNCYYLNSTVNGGNDIDECEGVDNKTSEELKTLSDVLGDAFKEDESGINNGYPILYWQ